MTDDGSSEKISMSLANWMRDLPAHLRDVPIIYLAIPGSHDSMTYGITRSSDLAPDAEPVLKKLYPLFRGTLLRWTITQALDASQQLHIGIRYLDMRLATKNGTESFYFTHGLYASEITQPLEQIREFLDTHPNEVVILDFQHFYSFTSNDHQRLIRFLLNMFGRKLVPRTMDVQRVTLNSMARLRQQIILIYRQESVFATGEFWPGQVYPSPWPQQDRVSGLLNYFTHVKRQPSAGFVHQAVLTPTPAFIVLRWISSLKEKCAVPVKDEVLPKIAEFSPGPPAGFESPTQAPVNVVIADFVDLDDAVFSKTIIKLNLKLLNTPLDNHNSG